MQNKIRLQFLPLILATLAALTATASGQSSAGYTKWKNWCISIGGTVSGTVTTPICTPPNRSQNPATQPTPVQPTQDELDREARDREIERQRKEKERKQQEDAVKAAEEAAKQADFIKKRDEAITDLKGLDSTPPTKLKEISSTDPCAPSKNASVVDACNPGSGLPKSVDNAINGAFKDAPPGVIERVRKGFQGVMNRQWNVASAWFKDALYHDPTNQRLKYLLKLINYDQTEESLKTPNNDDLKFLIPVPDDSKTSGQKGSASNSVEEALKKPNNDDLKFLIPVPDSSKKQSQKGSASTPVEESLKTPNNDDLKFLHPPSDDSKSQSPTGRFSNPVEIEAALEGRDPDFMFDSQNKRVAVPFDYFGNKQTFSVLPNNRYKPLFKASELEAGVPGLFNLPPESKVPIYRLNPQGNPVELPRDYQGKTPVFIKEKDGKLVLVPVDANGKLLFPDKK